MVRRRATTDRPLLDRWFVCIYQYEGDLPWGCYEHRDLSPARLVHWMAEAFHGNEHIHIERVFEELAAAT